MRLWREGGTRRCLGSLIPAVNFPWPKTKLSGWFFDFHFGGPYTLQSMPLTHCPASMLLPPTSFAPLKLSGWQSGWVREVYDMSNLCEIFSARCEIPLLAFETLGGSSTRGNISCVSYLQIRIFFYPLF